MLYTNNPKFWASSYKKPHKLIPWLEHDRSLTDKLCSIKGQVALNVLSQQWVKPTWWDTFFLSIQEDTIFQREIIMESQGIPYWYARTIIPKTCYDRHETFFDRLKKESVRNLIFDNDAVRRVQFMVYPIDKQCIEFYWVNKLLPHFEGTAWVRLAEFSIQNNASFFLLEILLPELEGVCQ